jgi:hypothetical protein
MPLIFQYGSNCDTQRLNSPDRLNGEARCAGTAQTVEEYELVSNVWGNGNGCAASDLIDAFGTGRHAWGVLYEIPEERIWRVKSRGQRTLEGIEGDEYRNDTIRVRSAALGGVEAITFLVIEASRQNDLWTSAQYVGHIVEGLRSHGVPEEYVQSVIETALETNTRAKDQSAAQRENALIEQLRSPD